MPRLRSLGRILSPAFSMAFSMAASLATWLALSLAAGPVLAQPETPFPHKPVTLVVPSTANSGSDIIARIIGPKLAARWGQPVIVDNRPGASGNLGTNQVAKAAPDGYTLLMMANTFTMTPAIYKSLPYDPVADFEPVATLCDASFALAVTPSLAVKDMPALMERIKASPGRINYASPGSGSPQHLAMELLKARYGLDVMHIPYKGPAGALTDLMGGQVQMMFATVPSVLPSARSSRLRLIAVTGTTRHPLAPDVPTFHEQGIDVMDTVDVWFGIMAPARTPAALVARLNRDVNAVLASDDAKAELARQGLTVRASTAPQFSALIASDLARWKQVVKDAAIPLE